MQASGEDYNAAWGARATTAAWRGTADKGQRTVEARARAHLPRVACSIGGGDWRRRTAVRVAHVARSAAARQLQQRRRLGCGCDGNGDEGVGAAWDAGGATIDGGDVGKNAAWDTIASTSAP
eukprot:gene5391-1553_t